MKPKLLVVEDNQLTLSLVSTIFSGLGFEVGEIDRGDEVLPYLGKNSADIIILDLELPGMNGDEVYAALKSDPKLKKIPVVPFTAHADTESETALARKLIRGSFIKTGHVTDIVFKANAPSDDRNVTKELIDEVARALVRSAHSLTPELRAYLKDQGGIISEDS